MTPSTLSSQQIGDAIRSFRQRNCPACEAEKVNRTDPFCLKCLEILPADLRARVTDREKYIGAFNAALTHLRGASGRAMDAQRRGVLNS